MSIQYDVSFSKPRGKAAGCAAGPALCLVFLGLLAGSTPAFAQSRPESPSDRYQVERADCYNGRSSEDGVTCLKEANAALDENRKGKLAVSGASYQRNAAFRCQALPAADKSDCEKRMRGEGTVSGSVESGGVLRELVVQSPVAANSR